MSETGVTAAAQGDLLGRRRQMIATFVALVAVLALSTFVFNGWLPSALQPSGPLEGGGGGITLPVHPGDTGAVFGLTLTNPARSDAVIDSAAIDPNAGLKAQRTPYVWDVTGRTSLAAWGTPLPPQWARLPRHAAAGYVLHHERSGARASGAALPELEIVFEFGVPSRTASLSSVTVRYHIGLRSYQKTFDTELTVCPPKDLHPCGW